MARIVFGIAGENRFEGLNLGFTTDERIISQTSTKVVGALQSTEFGDVRLTIIGEGLRLSGDGVFDAGTVFSSTLVTDQGLAFSVSGLNTPIARIDDIVTSPLVYRSSDIIIGSNDNDELFGFRGADTIRGRSGDDFLFGGGGADRLIGGTGSDSIAGGSGADQLIGGAGNDAVHGGGGADRISGGAGDDSRLAGAGGSDTIKGGGGVDGLFGGRGNDSLSGGAGDDVLSGEAGNDTMRGGGGEDRFEFDSRGFDLIEDFKVGDQIALTDQFVVFEFGDLLEFHLTDTDQGALISLNQGTLLIEGVFRDELTEGDFLLF